MMITGYILRRSETDYIINCDAQGNGGYNVVPKEIDPYNAYTIEEVEAYISENPEMILDLEEIEAAQLSDQVRMQRDILIENIEWRLSRYTQQKTMGLSPTNDSDDWYLSALHYVQELRNVPQQPGFPNDVEWPVHPDAQ